MPTRFITMLGDLGVLAIGRVYARGKERILWPLGPQRRKRARSGVAPRMMEDFMEEHEVETSGCSDLVVYFDTKADIEPTVEAGETLNANFALIVFTKARPRGTSSTRRSARCWTTTSAARRCSRRPSRPYRKGMYSSPPAPRGLLVGRGRSDHAHGIPLQLARPRSLDVLFPLSESHSEDRGGRPGL